MCPFGFSSPPDRLTAPKRRTIGTRRRNPGATYSVCARPRPWYLAANGITDKRHRPGPATHGQSSRRCALARCRPGLFAALFIGFAGTSGLTIPSASAQKLTQPDVPCTCRYKGEDYGIGDSICLGSGSGTRVATCSMVLNNTSWKMSNAPCPQALQIPPETPPTQHAAPTLKDATPVF